MPTPVAQDQQVNTQLLRRVLEHIASVPKQWNQRTYMSRRSCGTTYCLAGWTCELSGLDVAALLREGGSEKVFQTARRLLGLRYGQAIELFWYEHTPSGQHPTVAQLLHRVHRVTGVHVDP